MRILDTITTANSNLLRSKTRTILTILAIVIGTMTLTLTVAIGNGAKDYINNQTKAVNIPNALFVIKKGPASARANLFTPTDSLPKYNPQSATQAISNITLQDQQTIQSIPGVKKTYAIHTDISPLYITLDGVNKYTIPTDTYIPEEKLALAAGSMPTDSQTDDVILPYKAVKTFGYTSPSQLIGKTVTMAFANETSLSPTGQLAPVIREFNVAGVLVTNVLLGDNIFLSAQATNDIHQALNSTQTNPSVRTLIVITDQMSAKDLTNLQNTLNNKGFASRSFDDISSAIQGVITTVQIGLSLFAAIAILAATIGIVNTLLMAVLERSREIGLMKALGMGNHEIFRLFAYEAIAIGFWGGVLGIAAGIILGEIANRLAREYFLKGFEGYSLLTFPVRFLVLVFLINLLVAFCAGVIPAIKASRMNPIDALRIE